MLAKLVRLSGEALYGYFFIARSSRMQDMLNDERGFLPFETLQGELMMISKHTISDITEIINITALEHGINPYTSLGFTPTNNFAKTEREYKQLIMRWHPDRYKGDEYPEELHERMDSVCQYINAHFNQIKKEGHLLKVASHG